MLVVPVSHTASPAPTAVGAFENVTARLTGFVIPRAVSLPDTVPVVALAIVMVCPSNTMSGYCETLKKSGPFSFLVVSALPDVRPLALMLTESAILFVVAEAMEMLPLEMGNCAFWLPNPMNETFAWTELAAVSTRKR